jgi:hypothetical protein
MPGAILVMDPMVAPTQASRIAEHADNPMQWARMAFDHHVKSIDIMLWRLSRLELMSGQETVIRPDLNGISPFDFTQNRAIIEAGYWSARAILNPPEI